MKGAVYEYAHAKFEQAHRTQLAEGLMLATNAEAAGDRPYVILDSNVDHAGVRRIQGVAAAAP